MKDPGFIYVVRFWVAPEGQDKIMAWLKGGHIKEVVGYPGFLWCRSIDLGEKDDKGWLAYSMVYGIESEASFAVYQADALLQKKFVNERRDFAHLLRIERFSGSVMIAVDH